VSKMMVKCLKAFKFHSSAMKRKKRAVVYARTCVLVNFVKQ
jgi:hypothetical protein